MKRYRLTIVLLSVLIVVGIGFNVYQYQKIRKFSQRINKLVQEKERMERRVNVLTTEKERLIGKVNNLSEKRKKLTGQVSELNSEIESLDSKTRRYLEAEGRECEKETETCLDNLIERLTKVVGPDCSPISDGVCPKWCAAGADYDCCVEKGYEWIRGRGCYSK